MLKHSSTIAVLFVVGSKGHICHTHTLRARESLGVRTLIHGIVCLKALSPFYHRSRLAHGFQRL